MAESGRFAEAADQPEELPPGVIFKPGQNDTGFEFDVVDADGNDISLSGLRGKLVHGEPMAGHNVWAVGGAAERFFVPADEADLTAYLAAAGPDEPIFWLGLGSNLLVRDGGIRGTVVMTLGAFDDIAELGGTRLRLGAGTPCAKVARTLGRLGFAGGRADDWEADHVYWGVETKWLANDKRYDDEGKLEKPLAAVQMGLIYVNP